MKTLLEILKTTDQLNTSDAVGTDKNTTHCFIEHFYEKEFAKYKNKKISLLEIGMYSGGSIHLWGEFFEDGEVLGIDILDRIRDKWKTLPNIKHLIKDAYDESVVNSLGFFDIIIDDGPHSLESQIAAIKLYLPKLKDGGVFIIEDVQKFEDFNILKENTPVSFRNNIEYIDLRSIKNRYDDLLFVIRK